MILKFIQSTLSFILLALIGYGILVFFWGLFAPDRLKMNLIEPDPSLMSQRLQEVKKVENVDILFLGASTSYMGFDTRIFKRAGYKTFNLGSAAQTPEQTEVLLERYLNQLNPKLVVYEVLPEMMGRDGIEASLELISNDDIDLHLLELLGKTEPNLKVGNLLTYKVLSNVLPMDEDRKDSSSMEKEYIPGGFVETPIATNDLDDLEEFYGKAEPWEARQDQLKALDRNLDFLRNKKIPFLLVRAPITSYKYKSIGNNSYIDSVYKSKGPFLNFQKEVFLSDTLHFLDNTHLNQNGVERFNNKLLKIVQEILTEDKKDYSILNRFTHNSEKL